MSANQMTIPIYTGRRYPVGIGNASLRLGVSRQHLHKVLSGKRESRRLTAAYADLVAELKRSTGGLN